MKDKTSLLIFMIIFYSGLVLAFVPRTSTDEGEAVLTHVASIGPDSSIQAIAAPAVTELSDPPAHSRHHPRRVHPAHPLTEIHTRLS